MQYPSAKIPRCNPPAANMFLPKYQFSIRCATFTCCQLVFPSTCKRQADNKSSTRSHRKMYAVAPANKRCITSCAGPSWKM